MTKKVGTKNFSQEEFTFSATAMRLGIDNTLPESAYDNAQLVLETLQEIRDILGFPIYITSGYRSPELNAAIRGRPNSWHMYGLAADIVPSRKVDFNDFAEAVRYIVTRRYNEMENSMCAKVHELILEYDRWIHIAVVPNQPLEVFRYNMWGADVWPVPDRKPKLLEGKTIVPQPKKKVELKVEKKESKK